MSERDDPPYVALHAPAELAGLYSTRRALTESERVLLAADFERIRDQTGLLRRAAVGEVDAGLEGGTWTVARDNGEVYETPLAAIDGG